MWPTISDNLKFGNASAGITDKTMTTERPRKNTVHKLLFSMIREILQSDPVGKLVISSAPLLAYL
jgi:hypothetical protein